METQTLERDLDTSTGKCLYDTDFYQWSLKTAELIRQGRFAELDIENIAEDIESLGKNNKRELSSRISSVNNALT
ncbi:MAG: DUF29 domain-containing protein [Nitrospirae bacterium]|nr:DUF29 domain-containing protein [Nitrospirota bacterium]